MLKIHTRQGSLSTLKVFLNIQSDRLELRDPQETETWFHFTTTVLVFLVSEQREDSGGESERSVPHNMMSGFSAFLDISKAQKQGKRLLFCLVFVCPEKGLLQMVDTAAKAIELVTLLLERIAHGYNHP